MDFLGKLSAEKIAEIPFFNGLEYEELNDLSNFLKPYKFHKEEAVIKEGDKADSMFFILEGSAKVLKRSYAGTNEFMGSLSKPDFFGEMALLDSETRSTTVIAETELVVAELFWDNFQQTFCSKPDLIIYILINIGKTLSLRLRETNSLYANLLQNIREINPLI